MLKQRFLFVLVILFVKSSFADLTLKNTAPTDWGFWGNWELCPQNTLASGVQLKVQGRQWTGDDTALNAIKIFCTDIFNRKAFQTKLVSSEGPFGEWSQKVFQCDKGFLTGYQLRSEGDQGDGDDTAANNLRVFCSDPNVGTIEGDGMSWGSWGDEERCETKQALCGLKTQVSWDLGQYQDNVGLNNLEMKCCDIPYKIENCTPKDSWELIIECDNIKSTSDPLLCKLDKTRGIGPTNGFSDFIETMKNLGFSLESTGTILPNIFSHGLNISTKTGHDWTNEPDETWVPEKISNTEFSVPPGKLARIHQVVGTCGPIAVHTGQFKKEESDNPF